MSVETCSVGWDNDCTSPANLYPPERARATCFACGLPVCVSPGCSKVLTYKWYGRKRICRTCAIENGLGKWAA